MANSVYTTGGPSSLDAAYNGGTTITVDNGPVTLTAPDAADNVVLQINQNDTDTATKAVLITQNSNNEALEINGAGITNEGLVQFYTSNQDTGPILTLWTDSHTTGSALTITEANSGFTSTSGAVDINVTHASSTGLALTVNHAGTGANVVDFRGDVQSQVLLQLTGNSMTTGTCLNINSNSASTGVRSVQKITQQNPAASNSQCLLISDGKTTGTRAAVIINTSGPQNGLEINCSSSLSQNALVISNSSTAVPALVNFSNSSVQTGHLLRMTGSALTTGKYIWTDVGATLNADGSWTDPSTSDIKEDISELNLVSANIDSLRSMKLFKFKKKIEIYEREELGLLEKPKKPKFKTKKKDGWENAPFHEGLILDDPTTPAELAPKDVDGDHIGFNATRGVNYLLKVCKELIMEVDALKAQLNP